MNVFDVQNQGARPASDSPPIKESLLQLYTNLDRLTNKAEQFEDNLFPDAKTGQTNAASTPPPSHLGELIDRLHQLFGRLEDKFDRISSKF